MRSGTIELLARALQLRKPGEGLTAVAALRSHLDALEAAHVENALQAGWSWSQVATALGVSKQAAHRKYAKRLAAKADGVEHAQGPGRLLVTAEARRSVQAARREALELGADDVRPEHLLLGLLDEAHGPAWRALTTSGGDFDAMRTALRRGPRREVEAAVRRPISPAARRVLEQSLREAVRLRDGHLGVEHLLLALLGDEDGDAARLLAAAGTSAARVRRRLEAILDQPTLVFRDSG